LHIKKDIYYLNINLVLLPTKGKVQRWCRQHCWGEF